LTDIEDSANLLSEFGLTPYESRIYLASIRLGVASASEISKKAKVRREEVYRTIPKLEKLGIMERLLGRPVKFRALSLEEGVSLLLKKKEQAVIKELQDLAGKKEVLLETFEAQAPEYDADSEESEFILVTEKDTVAMRVESLIGKSESRIDIADSTFNIIRFLLTFEEKIKEALERGVKLRLLTDYPDDEEAVQRILINNLPKENVRLRYLDAIPSSYALFDGTDVMLSTSADGSLTNDRTLWTCDANLVSVIKRDFEEQFNRSVDWFTYISTPVENVLRSLKFLKPRDHVVLFYDSIDMKHEILFNYLKGGLDIGEAATYICTEETPEEILSGMREFGIDVDAYTKNGALKVISYSEFYIKDGKFDIQEVMDGWDTFYEETRSAGFKGLRVTGEMSCFIKHDLIDELLEYEKALHSVLDMPIMAVCAYSSQALGTIENPVNVYSEIVKAHGKVLYANEANSLGYLELRK
jgi:sugar-specific transcriptional regulator TrmB